jgi:glutamate dehydrogenase
MIEKEPIVKSIINIAKKEGLLSSNLENFIQHFYSSLITAEFANIETEQLFNIIDSCYQFTQDLEIHDRKIRVLNPSKETGQSQFTIIEIIASDMPFILDSVIELLKKNNLTIYINVHALITTIRNDQGSIIKIGAPGAHNDRKFNKEALAHLSISKIDSKKKCRAIKQEINKALNTVKICVSDWQKMVNKVSYSMLEISQLYGLFLEDETKESYKFLEWLRSDNFVFLGYVKYSFTKKQDEIESIVDNKTLLGIARQGKSHDQISVAPPNNIRSFITSPKLIEITKSDYVSVVHRHAYMDCICIKIMKNNTEVIGQHCFFGLFTSVVYYQDTRLIPIIRKKVLAVEELVGASIGNHINKEIAAILRAFPCDELFQSSEQYLFDCCMNILKLSTKSRELFFARIDPTRRFVSCIIYIPQAKFSTALQNKIEGMLTEAFRGKLADKHIVVGELYLARLQLLYKTNPETLPEINIETLKEKIVSLSQIWVDELQQELRARLSNEQSDDMFNKYKTAFLSSYREEFSVKQAYHDILKIEEAMKLNTKVVALYSLPKDCGNRLRLKIYIIDRAELTLSEAIPIIENMSTRVLTHHRYKINLQEKTGWIHHLYLEILNTQSIDLSAIKEVFEEALIKILNGNIENDGFNKLIILTGLYWRDITLIRAWSKYLQQIEFRYSQNYIQDALVKHSEIAVLLAKLFHIKFNPKLAGNYLEPQKAQNITTKNIKRIGRKKLAKTYIDKIENALLGVKNISEDTIIKGLISIINAISRTNYYQKYTAGELKGKNKPYISFKIKADLILYIPLPRPFAEVFVYSAHTEGIHLRGGEVARGGIRWSDRIEDFRTEGLGLMKAQMTKNTLIIPVGAKGCFITKKSNQEKDKIEDGLKSYRVFLQGILDVTDNIINDKIAKAKQMIRYDKDDPYLVVAADKGTAAFSDYANKIAKEYNFWLGDAFASGGSAGYDHKKLGITARGAWISVEYHFNKLGKDIREESFTVVGIGDMAGDVFGNGMLLSNKIKLVAAFNHQHIFIDPNPDPVKSYLERERLFKKPRSTWADYSKDCISDGGGLFNRSSKRVNISPQIKKVLEIKENTLSTAGLIKAILKAPVDLLWGAGIGTFIKSSKETNEMVRDKSNDVIRINGNEVRAKIITEGGNLGLTQLGRIEYARKGGIINTDFVDNSSGVSCSDREVNIKIALSRAMELGKISLEERNKILLNMQEEATNLVLLDNKLQNIAISVAQINAPDALEQHKRLMRGLEKQGILNREVENLPSNKVIEDMLSRGIGLSRPELAVLLAYSKMTLYNELIDSKLPDEDYFNRYLVSYFPKILQNKFSKEIQSHPLRREIIATYVTNSVINRAGMNSIFDIVDSTGMPYCDVLRIYIVIRDSFNLKDVWYGIEDTERKVSSKAKAEVLNEAQQLTENSMYWLLRHHAQPIQIGKAIKELSASMSKFFDNLQEVITKPLQQMISNKVKKLTSYNLKHELAIKIAMLELLEAALSMTKVAQETNHDIIKIAKIYFLLGEKLHITKIKSRIRQDVGKKKYWSKFALKTVTEELYDQQMYLTKKVVQFIEGNESCSEIMEKWCKSVKKPLKHYKDFIINIKNINNIDINIITVIVNKLKSLNNA